MHTLTALMLAILLATVSAQLCAVCEGPVAGLRAGLKAVLPTSWIADAIQIMCMNKFDNKKLCEGIGKELAPIAKKNVINNFISPHHWCSLVCRDAYHRYDPQAEVARILAGQAASIPNLSTFVERETIVVPEKSSLSILHLSDIHLDSNYTEGSSIQCDYPICCHSDDGFPENPTAQAGPFGNKNCDCPAKLLDSLLTFLRTKEQPDIVVATGDFSAHNEWEKTKESISSNENKIQQQIQQILQPAVIIQAQGNNDYSPDHQFDPRAGKLMKVFRVESGTQAVTFISLNTMVFDDMNMFLFGDQSYSIFQLLLLEQELASNENVVILGHVPPTLRGAAPQFQAVYRALIARYSGKVKGQFFGHTHMDMLTVNTYPSNSDLHTGFGFVSPSVSPYGVSLSRTRVYEFGLSPSVGVIDYIQYRNKDITALTSEWMTEYTFRQKYNLGNERVPLTLEQIAAIKGAIIQQQKNRMEYVNTTGLSWQRRKEKIYCQIFDDPEQRRKCESGNLSKPDLFTLIDLMRGSWGYDLTDIAH